jgi:hypothetical protein
MAPQTFKNARFRSQSGAFKWNRGAIGSAVRAAMGLGAAPTGRPEMPPQTIEIAQNGGVLQRNTAADGVDGIVDLAQIEMLARRGDGAAEAGFGHDVTDHVGFLDDARRPAAGRCKKPGGAASGFRRSSPVRTYARVELYSARILAALTALAQFSTMCVAQENISEVIFVAHELHLQERSGIGLKGWHGIHGKKNFAVAVMGSCSTCNVGLIHYGQESFGDGYWTTGRVVKRTGERWWVAFPGPRGYDICSASLDPERDIFLIDGSSTTGTVVRNPRTGENWVESVSYAPKNGPEGHGVNVRFIAKYVPTGAEGAHHCAVSGTRIWEAHR